MNKFNSKLWLGNGIFWIIFCFCLAWVSVVPVIAVGDAAEAAVPGSKSLPDITDTDWQKNVRVTEAIFIDEKERTNKKLSLQQCIERTLHHNLDIRFGGKTPAIQMSEIIRAEAAFDAVLFANMQFVNTDKAELDTGFFTQTIATDSGTKTVKIPTDPFNRNHDDNYSLGLRKRLPTGASIELAESLRRLRILTDDGDDLFRNPFYQYAIQLRLRQPLLRDFGIDLNRASILAARNNFRISQKQFERLIIETLVNVERNYWRLVFARQRVKIFEDLHRRARQTLERVLERKDHDASSLAVARADAETEKARANWISSRTDVLQQQDLLLQSMNDPHMSLEEKWEIIPVDIPTFSVFDLDYETALRTALKMRPEIAEQKLRIDTAHIVKGVAKNQKLPRLDLFAEQEVTGAGDESHNAWDQQWSHETITSTIGLSFEIPLGNRAAEAAYGKARLELEQEKIGLKNTQEQIRADVNIALHNLKNIYKEISARRKAVEKDRDEVLTYLAIQETERQDSVTPSFLNLKLNADNRLANSQVSAMQTILEYNLAIMDAHRAQGLLLRYNNVKLAESSGTK